MARVSAGGNGHCRAIAPAAMMRIDDAATSGRSVNNSRFPGRQSAFAARRLFARRIRRIL